MGPRSTFKHSLQTLLDSLCCCFASQEYHSPPMEISAPFNAEHKAGDSQIFSQITGTPPPKRPVRSDAFAPLLFEQHDASTSESQQPHSLAAPDSMLRRHVRQLSNTLRGVPTLKAEPQQSKSPYGPLGTPPAGHGGAHAGENDGDRTSATGTAEEEEETKPAW